MNWFSLLAQTTDYTLVGALVTAVLALAGVVAKLWTTHEHRFTRVETKLDECESDRQELWRQLAKIDPTCQHKSTGPASPD